MKKLLTYLTISASIFLLFSCDKPAPTQLIDDSENDYEVELLNKDYTSGSDTSGITQDLAGITNLISVSGIKISTDIRTSYLSMAQAMFFDKSKPIKFSNGRILAYETTTPGIIKFNGLEARLDTFKIKYRDLGIPKVAILGQKYVLYNLLWGIPDPFYFSYNSSVSFEFDPSGVGQNVSFNILTPQEITGTVVLNGNRNNKDIEAVLNWNSGNTKKISIIVGLKFPNQQSSVPIYKFRTADDGRMRIPRRLLNQIPLEEFEKIVFTFIRSYEAYHENGNNDLLVSSQSIHSIVIDIP